MPSSVSVKERILRQIRTTCAAVTGVASAYRWDTGRWWNGTAWVETLPRNSVQVAVESDEMIEEALGLNGPVMRQMTVAVQVKLIRDSDETTVYDSLVTRWQNDIEAALMGNPFIVEAATSIRLATDSRITSTPPPATDSGQAEVVAVVMMQVDYRHNRNNPSSLGSVISAVTE